MKLLSPTPLVLWSLLGYSYLIAAHLTQERTEPFDRNVSRSTFLELEELSRLVAISYCVGETGIQKPFECLSHCSDFKGFELVKTWSTGIVDPSSSGYLALSHPPWPRRILAIFRGTHSLSDTIHDLMTTKAEYVPYPINDTHCTNCTVHSGFMSAWQETKTQILSTLEMLRAKYPDYRLVLAGHSLGGAAAGLGALELKARGWDVEVTTFGEPRLGNKATALYMDSVFPWNVSESESKFRRVTHTLDPVPLLPLEDWGWHMHGGEIFISKDDLPPDVDDLERCEGDQDGRCIGGPVDDRRWLSQDSQSLQLLLSQPKAASVRPGLELSSPEIRNILIAHRQYFWRIGSCFDPQWHDYPKDGRS